MRASRIFVLGVLAACGDDGGSVFGDAAVTNDAQLFVRSASGSINSYYVDTVANYVVTTNVSNKQLQFMDGAP